ncbi:MAG: hypothetical protein P4M09_07710 [Devosia sp.]|nr:hypothetical protein [Devosia sp.]
MIPIVLVEIDRDSRMRVLQTSGVRLVIADHRVDPIATLFPEADQLQELLAAVADLPLLAPGSGDDLVQSAVAAIRRVRSGLTIVASGPLIKLGENS